MKKDPNSQSKLRRLTLPKSKILRGRANFAQLFKPGIHVISGSIISLRYIIYTSAPKASLRESDCKMAFITPKKLGKAVRRNRARRLLKEAYRLNHYIIMDESIAANVTFHGALMAKKIEVEFGEINTDVINLLRRVKNHIQKIEE